MTSQAPADAGSLDHVGTPSQAPPAGSLDHAGTASQPPPPSEPAERLPTATGAPAIRVRRAQPDDVDAIHALVVDLARYERAEHEVIAVPADLDRALFGQEPAVFAHVAEADGEVVGFALWFQTYSTWDGRSGIWLEDLFVRPAHRGSGAGRALLSALASECRDRGWSRLQWWVLDWNEPALGFYRRLGATAMDEWTVHRVTGPALAALAAAGDEGSEP
jgi:GNAT superfamily N-acetyltransferase